MTHFAPDSRSIGALISPVNAPESLGYMFWALTATRVDSSSWATAASAVNGGATSTSTLSNAAVLLATSVASVHPDAPPWFNFQLPAMSGRLERFMKSPRPRVLAEFAAGRNGFEQ